MSPTDLPGAGIMRTAASSAIIARSAATRQSMDFNLSPQATTAQHAGIWIAATPVGVSQ